MIHRLSQLDTDNAGYAEKLLQASTVGHYCKRLVGIMQVQSTLSQQGSLFYLSMTRKKRQGRNFPGFLSHHARQTKQRGTRVSLLFHALELMSEAVVTIPIKTVHVKN